MLGKNEDKTDNQTEGVLIQYIHDLSSYLYEHKLMKKVVTMTVALIMLAGLMGVHYKQEGTILPVSGTASNKELPIYCVQTDEPKIALTFDAAWAEVSLLEAAINTAPYSLCHNFNTAKIFRKF